MTGRTIRSLVSRNREKPIRVALSAAPRPDAPNSVLPQRDPRPRPLPQAVPSDEPLLPASTLFSSLSRVNGDSFFFSHVPLSPYALLPLTPCLSTSAHGFLRPSGAGAKTEGDQKVSR